MTHNLLRAGALSCALLATTCLTAPAAAQAPAPALPSVYQHVDANGVDMVDGSFNFALTEGSIGTGPGAIRLVRYRGVGGVSDNLTLRFERRIWGTEARISLVFGNRTETFTGTLNGTAFTAEQGSGATLVRTGESTYSYTADDGTVTTYGPPAGLKKVAGNGVCNNFHAYDCGLIALQTRRPNGEITNYLWDAGENCLPPGYDSAGNPLYSCDQFWRQRGVSTNSGFRLRFAFREESNPAVGAPGEAWHERTGASLSNDLVAAPQRTVSYATPAPGVTQITTDGGDIWRIVEAAREVRIRRPGSTADNLVVALTEEETVASVTADGVRTDYTRTVAGDTVTATATNGRGDTATFVSELSTGRPAAITDPLGHTTRMQYDDAGRPTRITAPEGNYVTYRYDGRGNVDRVQRVPKPGDLAPTITTSSAYPLDCQNPITCNRPTSTTDARGNVTLYEYSADHGGVTRITRPSPDGGATRPQRRIRYEVASGIALPHEISDCASQPGPDAASCVGTSAEVRSTIAYNAQHLPRRIEAGAGDGSLTAVAELVYDGNGDLVTVDGPLAGTGDTIRYRYDQARRREATISPDPDGAGILRNRAERITYRGDGQVSRVEIGNVASQANSDWGNFEPSQRVETTYDAGGRPVSQALRAGSTTYALSAFSYDDLGRLECVAQRMDQADWGAGAEDACHQDPSPGLSGSDRITRTLRDARGRVSEVRTAVDTELETSETRLTYTPNGRLEWLTDAQNNRTSYVYDSHDRLRRIYYPVANRAPGAPPASDPGEFEEFGYDDAGNVTGHRNRAAETTLFAHDPLGRLTSVARPNGEAGVSYAYDLLGRTTRAEIPDHPVTFGYDALGRKVTESSPRGIYRSRYDLAGRRTRLTHPDGFFVEQEWLLTNELERIREWNPATNQPGYMIAEFAYDDIGRRTSLTRGNGLVTSYRYAGPRMDRMSDMPSSPTHGRTLDFGHNPAGQIVSVAGSNDLYSFAPAAGVQTATPDGLNRIALLNGAPTAYDARGNMTADGTATYSYSSNNLMTAAAGVPLYYDPLNRLVQVTGSTPTRFTYDGASIVAEWDGQNNLLRRYVHGPAIDEPLVQYEGTGNSDRRYFHADERGSLVAASDSGANVLWINRYDEYGRPQSGNMGRFQYTGQPWIAEIGLSYYRARMYNARLGRFMQTDPISYGDGMNMYAYVGGDPVNATDPRGTIATDPEEGEVDEGETDDSPITVNGFRRNWDYGSDGSSIWHGSSVQYDYFNGNWDCVETDCVYSPAIVVIGRRRSIFERFPPPRRGLEILPTIPQDVCGGGGQTWPPDRAFGADFTSACSIHDSCYESRSTHDRLQCDIGLRQEMKFACFVHGAPEECYVAAHVYYIAVRWRGRDLYEGQGSNE